MKVFIIPANNITDFNCTGYALKLQIITGFQARQNTILRATIADACQFSRNDDIRHNLQMALSTMSSKISRSEMRSGFATVSVWTQLNFSIREHIILDALINLKF